MKKIVYYFINRLGYNIENKKKRDQELIKPISKFKHLENFNLLVLAKNYILNLDNKFNNFSIKNHKEGFLVRFLDYEIYLESLEEFHILNEVFINDDYRFTTNNDSILIDIGANIGITSLFYSQYSFITKIYAYEPVEFTFNQAKYNLRLNKKIHKVEWIKNIGLGKNNRKEYFLFNKNTKGNTGVRGELSDSYSKDSQAEKVEVEICDASFEINVVLDSIKNEKVIVKMDCEGAEYEIIENLHNSKVLNKIDVLLIEWHDKGSQKIEESLIKSGFNFFSKDFSSVAGMIYAYKKNS